MVRGRGAGNGIATLAHRGRRRPACCSSSEGTGPGPMGSSQAPGRSLSFVQFPASGFLSKQSALLPGFLRGICSRKPSKPTVCHADEAEGQDVGPPVAEDEAVHENGRAADWGAPADGPGLPSDAGVAADALPSQDPSPRFAALAEDLDAGADGEWGDAVRGCSVP